VAVVGAGLAGLTAALDLRSAGYEVVVLEARHRVGGRTVNAELGDGKVVEMGGEWIGPTQDAIAELARDLGVETFPTYYDGEHLARIDGEIRRHPEPFPELRPEVQVQVEAALRDLESRAATVPVDAPWDAPDAEAMDATSFEEWVRANVGDPEVRGIVRIVSDIQATPAAELSLLWTLYSLAASNGFASMANVPHGAQQDRFVGGSQLVSIRAAERLGDAVVLDAPVDRITTSGTMTVVRSERLEVGCRRVVVAAPPGSRSSRRCRRTPTRSCRGCIPGR